MKIIRRRTSQETKIAHNKTFDHIEKDGMTPEQRKNWERKPYGLGGGKKNDNMQSR